MMKQFSLFLILFIALWMPAWSQMRGDINNDNKVDVSDVNIMIDMVLGKQAQNLGVADLDGDNLIDVSDVNAIIDIVLGKTSGGADELITETFTVNGVSFKMVYVEGGSFYIGETEVTQELYKAVTGDEYTYHNDCDKGDKNPAHSLLWSDCQSFIKQLNAITGKTFRLPTEAEWEFAAKGGSRSKGYIYAGSDNYDDVAWYWRNSGNEYLNGAWNSSAIDRNVCRVHPVATKFPNELGIYDMCGNVSEWCQDFYGYFEWDWENPFDDYGGPVCDGAAFYGVKGGSWTNVEIPIERKSKQTDCGAIINIGFRLAL